FAPGAADCDFTLTELTPEAGVVAPAAEAAPPPPAVEVAPPAAAAPADVAAAEPVAAASAPMFPSAQEAPGNGKEARGAAKQPSSVTIRVELEKIDRVVNMVGELVIAQAI